MKATVYDIPEMLILCELMHSESSYDFIMPNEEKMESFLFSKIDMENSFCYVLKKEKTIGLLVANIETYFFSNSKIAVDYIFFIKNEYRKSSGAYKLLMKYIEWAKESSVVEIMLSTTTGVKMEKVGKLYEKIGFKKVGLIYKLKHEE